MRRLVDLMPSGRFLMEEFYYAGGLPAVLRRLGEHGPAAASRCAHRQRPVDLGQRARRPELQRRGDPPARPAVRRRRHGILRGNLAPRGAVLKPSAASPELLKHTGRAVVFENLEHYKARIVDDALDVDASCVLVMKNCGPKGYPGMAEVGNMGLPPKLLRQGVQGHGAHLGRAHERHRLRHGGAACGARRPRPAGRWPLVRDGDWIELDCAGRRLHLDISEAELAARLAACDAATARAGRGYQTPVRRPRAAGRRRLRLRLPGRLPRLRRAARQSLTGGLSMTAARSTAISGVFPVAPTIFDRARRARPRGPEALPSTS